MNSSKIHASKPGNSFGFSAFGWISATWWLLWTLLVYFLFLTPETDPFDAAMASVVHVGLMAIICTGSFFAMRYTRPDAVRFAYAFIGILLLAFAWSVAAEALMHHLFDPKELPLLWEPDRATRMAFGGLMITLFVVLGWMFYYVQEQLSDSFRMEELKRLAREAELQALRYQVHPHFLFNTLNSVYALAGTDAAAARNMILLLSDFLRETLKQDLQQKVRFADELEQLNRYLEIEKVRFGGRLVVEFDIDSDVPEHPIPPILLQPLAENSIKHGLYGQLGPVHISLVAKTWQDGMEVSISNPCDPDDAEQPKGTGFGLNSIRRRMYLFYGRNDLVTTATRERTFTATIRIPK